MIFNQEPPDPGPSLPEEAGAGEVEDPELPGWRRDVLPGDLGPLLAHTEGDLRPGVSSQVLRPPGQHHPHLLLPGPL